MEIHHVALGLVLFSVFFVQSGHCILCWECNSEYDRRCADPFLNHTFVATDCDQRFLFHYPKHNATVCRKMVQRVKGDYRYIRSCGFLEDSRTDCYRRAGTFDVQIEYCQCNSDGCNHAAVKKSTAAHSITAAAILLFAYHLHSTSN